MKILKCSIFFLLATTCCVAYASQPTGGVWRANSAATAIPPLSAAQIQQLLPNRRGSFSFPAPYNTTGYRVTLPSDCGGQNCVQYIGYNLWANMNQSAGSNTLYIFVGLNVHKGGGGPTLFKMNKTNGEITKVGPIFPASGHMINSACEGCYFSHISPTELYYVREHRVLEKINVLTHQEQVVFDANSYKQGGKLYVCSSSADQTTHGCTYEEVINGHWERLGCLIYHSDTEKFQYFEAMTDAGVHRCAIFPDGKHAIMSEKTPDSIPGAAYLDTVIIDLATGEQTIIDLKRGGGHNAEGYDSFVMLGGAFSEGGGRAMLWNTDDLDADPRNVFFQPWSVKCVKSVCAGAPSHPSWLNAVPADDKPLAEQYVCDSTNSQKPSLSPKPLAENVFCYYLDGENRSLIIAPILSGFNHSGCPGGAYGQQPKGNIDYTGHYFIWSGNLKTDDNCQVFIVKIPTSQLPYPPPVVTPPQVSITQPANATTVSGTVPAQAHVQTDIKISNVEWEIDGQEIGSSETAPYTYDVDTDNFALGSHRLTAVATDSAGNTGTATNNIVVAERSSAPALPAPMANSNSSGGGSLSLLPLAALGLLLTIGLARKLAY